MKKFWKYFIIVILALIGLAAIGLLYIFIVPNSSLFGICYISHKDDSTSITYDTSTNLIDNVVLNNDRFDVSVVTTSTSKGDIYCKVFDNSFGFVLKKNSSLNIASKLSNTTLTFDITEPNGACFPSKSKITLYIPSGKKVNLTLNNKSADCTIQSEKLTFGGLRGTTNNGAFEIDNCSIDGNLSFALNRGYAVIGEKTTTNNNKTTIETKSGNFTANIALGEVEVKSNNRARVKIKSCQKFTMNTSVAGGAIEIDEVVDFVATSSDTNITLGTITGGGAITLTKNGKINIDKVQAQMTAQTHNGNITVNSASSPVFLTATGEGDINLKSTTASLLAQSNYGDITVNFVDEADSFKTNTNSRKLQAKTANGRINAIGVENVTINITGSGSADIYMRDVIGANQIEAKAGSVYLEFATAASFKLKTKAETGSVNVNYYERNHVGLPNHEQKDEAEFSINSPADDSNYLIATVTSGSLKVRDTAMKDF